MAIIGQWTGGTITSMIPTTSWAAPNGMFPTQARNDDSEYSFVSSTSTITIPIDADGYLIVAAFEFNDSSNGRHNPQGKIIQTTGGGNFISGWSGGYNRDNSEDRSYVRCWGFIDSPSGDPCSFQFQWKRDTDTPSAVDGTVRSSIQVIPLYYSDVAGYNSTTSAVYGGTTPNKVTGFSGLDGTNIKITTDTITVSGDNKRYLIFGSYFMEATGDARTQRWGGLTIDSTKVDATQAYSMYRNDENNESGEIFTWLIETETASQDIEMFLYRGDGVASGDGGADNDGGDTPTNSNHSIVILELHDGAEVFQSIDGTGAQQLALTGPVDMNISRTTDITFNDSASFTRSTDIAMNIEKDMDVLLGGNASAASTALSNSRYTAHGEFTINGAENTYTFSGDYLRGAQSGKDTYGWGVNLLSALAVTSGDDVGLSVQELTGTEGGGGGIVTNADWVGFWGINLDTLEPSEVTRRVFITHV